MDQHIPETQRERPVNYSYISIPKLSTTILSTTLTSTYNMHQNHRSVIIAHTYIPILMLLYQGKATVASTPPLSRQLSGP